MPTIVSCLIVLIMVTHQLTAAAAAAEPDFAIHSEEWLIGFLSNISTAYPNLTYLYSIGKSVLGRDLWVLAIGESPREHVLLRPEVKYVGNIHGNEVVSRELLIQLIHYLVYNYGRNATVTRLLNTTRIHVLVSMNPDGFAVAQNNGNRDCFGVRGRGNAYNYDLNRNFPDYFVKNPAERQIETQAMMDWLNRTQFILSGTLHGGALVANYPYDNLPQGGYSPSYSRSTDDDVFIHLAKTYSYAHPTMHLGQPCHTETEVFREGIVNGASWYLVTGSMQDYNYIFGGCMDLTLEISCCKYPHDNQVESFWIKNKDALIRLLTQVHLGVKGLVLTHSRHPIAGASVRIVGRLHGHKTTSSGEFWRILLPGVYTIEVNAYGYQPLNYTFNLTPKTQRAAMEGRSHANVKRSTLSVWPDHTQDVAVLEITLDEDTSLDKGNGQNGETEIQHDKISNVASVQNSSVKSVLVLVICSLMTNSIAVLMA